MRWPTGRGQGDSDTISLIDLKANPPRVVDTVTVGQTAVVEKDLWVFEWNGSTLRDTGQRIKVNGGSAALRTAEK